MKKYLILGIIPALIIGFSSSMLQKTLPVMNNPEVEVNKEEPHKIYIPIIAKGLQAKFWDSVKLGAEKAASEYGVDITFEGTVLEKQTEEQLKYLITALTKHPGAIVLSAIDSKAVTPYLEEAQAAGIPVIGFDSGVDSPIVKTTVGTDNYGAGALAADKIAELLGKEGEVAVIVQDETSEAATRRRDGFINTIEQQYPKMKVVAIGYAEENIENTTEGTKKIIEENPNLKGIFAENEAGTQGVINAIKELNKQGEIMAIGFDSGQLLLDAIREGVVVGAVTQNPEEIGYKAVETAVKAYRGEELPAFIDTGFAWYDKTNIDNPEIQKLLYE